MFVKIQVMLTIRLAFRFSSHEISSVLLAYRSPFLSYSFIAADFSQPISPTNLPLTTLTPFLSSINHNKSLLQAVQQEDCSHIDLQSLISNTKIQKRTLQLHAPIIKQLAELFTTLTEEIRTKLRQNDAKRVVEWMTICRALAVIDLPIWSRLLAMTTIEFSNLSHPLQLQAVDHIHWLLKNCFLSFNYAPSKFVYRENYLIDLGNIRSFLQAVLPSPTSPLSPVSFQQVIASIDKIVRMTVLNIHHLIEQYEKNEQYYLDLLDKGDLKTAGCLLRYYAILGLADPKRIGIVEKRIMELWPNEIGSKDICLEVSNVLWAWSCLGHNNPALYSAHIRPEICHQLAVNIDENTNKLFFINWLYNLIGCQLDDFTTLQQLLSHATRLCPADNKMLHTINHYLSVRDGLKREGPFSRCQQDQLTIDIVKQNPKIYSSCMLRPIQAKDAKRKQQTKKLQFEKELGFEDSPPEQFWTRLLNKAFLELVPLYKDKGEIRFNVGFCIFELDALLTLGGVNIAFELAGSHYRLKSPQGEQGDLQGRKRIKYAILQAYGLKILQIDSTGLIQRNINSFQSQKAGIKFLKERLAAMLPPPDHPI